MASVGLDVANVGSRPTYRRWNAESVIDVTFFRHASTFRIAGWDVLDIFSDSDHQYIHFVAQIGEEEAPIRTAGAQPRHLGWATRQLDPSKLASFLEVAPSPPLTIGIPELLASALTDYLTRACDSCMARRTPFRPRRKPVHWWNPQIGVLRRSCMADRRRYQRSRRRNQDDSDGLRIIYQNSRKLLRAEIRKAQEKSWQDLCRLVDSDPWGLPYRVVAKRLRRGPPGVEARGREAQIADHLFPQHPQVNWELEPITQSGPTTVQFFTPQDLGAASKRLPPGKAPGPDGIPNEALQRITKIRPGIFLDIFNKCLEEGTFPCVWKEARLVLLHKGAGKPLSDPSSFRPLSLLNTPAKLLERMLLARLDEHLDSIADGRSPNQFGFRTGRSTCDAASTIIEIARAAARKATRHRHMCVVVSLDVTNAFNSAPWSGIDRALRLKDVPPYLRRILRSYLADRTLLVGDEGTPRRLSGGVPQGSVLGPALWNIFYEDLLNLPLSDGVRLVAFADDVAVVGTARTGELLEKKLNPALSKVADWIRNNGLRLAAHKSEAVLLTTKILYTAPDLRIDGQQIEVKDSMRYLGVEIDRRLNFSRHVAEAADRAAGSVRALSRLMPNLGGPSNGKRRLLASVVNSKLLYATPVWADTAMALAKNRTKLLSQQRRVALKVIRAYRTVSTDVALALAELPPADLLCTERSQIASKSTGKAEARSLTIGAWVARWAQREPGWTGSIIPDLRKWLTRGLRPPLTYHLTQALTGHGCFQAYLFRMARALSPECLQCGAQEDTAEHTLLHCPHWAHHRTNVFREGVTPSAEMIGEVICGPQAEDLPEDRETRRKLLEESHKRLEAFITMVHGILIEKEQVERDRQMEERATRNATH